MPSSNSFAAMTRDQLKSVLHSAAYDSHLLNASDYDQAIEFVENDTQAEPAQRAHMVHALVRMKDTLQKRDNLAQACRHLRRVLLNLPVDKPDALWSCAYIEALTKEVGVIPGQNGVDLAQAIATVRMKYPRT